MKLLLFIFIFFNYSLTVTLFAQNYLPVNSPIIGEWELISPKKSPGPEFVVETYIGIAVFKLAAEQNTSMAAASYNKEDKTYLKKAEFIAQWDGNKLTGTVFNSNWPKVSNPLMVNVPLVYNAKKDLITIHINNPEYGNVKFIYKRIKTQ